MPAFDDRARLESPVPCDRPAHDAEGTARFSILEPLLPVGFDYRVEDAQGHEVFRVDGKVWRIPETLDVFDAERRHLFSIRGGVLDVKNTFHIAREGQDIVTIRRVNDAQATESFLLELPERETAQIVGDVRGRQYSIAYGGQTRVSVSRPRSSRRERFVVDIAPDQEAAVAIAIAIGLDVMTRL